MNINDIMINKIKEFSKKLVDDNITFPNEMDYLLIEQAMLRGASIAFESMSKESKNKEDARYAEQLIHALEKKR